MNLAFSNLDAQRRIGGKMIAVLTWAMIPVVVGARLAVHDAVTGLAVASALAALGASLARRFAGETSAGRSLVGVALMAQVSLLVSALSGRPRPRPRSAAPGWRPAPPASRPRPGR